MRPEGVQRTITTNIGALQRTRTHPTLEIDQVIIF